MRYRLSAAAQADIVDILEWTHAHFGAAARLRYQALIITALRDVAAAPERPGSTLRAELGEDVRTWHLRLSRERARTSTGVVRQPRHLLVYRVEVNRLVVGRILHDAMEHERHVESDETWR